MQLGFLLTAANEQPLADFLVFIPRVVSFLWPIIGVLLFAMFVYGGFMWALAGGNAQNVQKAQGIIMWAVIGTVIALGSAIIMNIFGSVLGIQNVTSINVP